MKPLGGKGLARCSWCEVPVPSPQSSPPTRNVSGEREVLLPCRHCHRGCCCFYSLSPGCTGGEGWGEGAALRPAPKRWSREHRPCSEGRRCSRTSKLRNPVPQVLRYAADHRFAVRSVGCRRARSPIRDRHRQNPGCSRRHDVVAGISPRVAHCASATTVSFRRRSVHDEALSHDRPCPFTLPSPPSSEAAWGRGLMAACRRSRKWTASFKARVLSTSPGTAFRPGFQRRAPAPCRVWNRRLHRQRRKRSSSTPIPQPWRPAPPACPWPGRG